MALKLWHISDSHGYHNLLKIPKNIDIVIFSGDASNYRDPYLNVLEMENFIRWFKMLPIKHKIFVAGNHDTSIEKNLIKKSDFEGYNIIYLENDYTTIEGLKIFGSPNTPQFNMWAFMKDRSKLDKHWSKVDDDVDIFIVHGPPKGILDYAWNTKHSIERCGDSALRNHILKRIKPKLCLFGHIHNNEDIINAGVIQLSTHPTIFSNGSIMTDRKFGTLSSNGNLFRITKTKKITIL